MKIICEICGRAVTDEKKGFLCDYPLGTSYTCRGIDGVGTHASLNIDRLTCDKQMCEKCATEIGPGMHFCPVCARKTFMRINAKRWELPEEVVKEVWLDNECAREVVQK